MYVFNCEGHIFHFTDLTPIHNNSHFTELYIVRERPYNLRKKTSAVNWHEEALGNRGKEEPHAGRDVRQKQAKGEAVCYEQFEDEGKEMRMNRA